MSVTQVQLDTLRFPVSALPAFDPMGLTAIATSDVFSWMHQDVLVGRPSSEHFQQPGDTYHVAGDRTPIEWRTHLASSLWLTTEHGATRYRLLRWIVNREWILNDDVTGPNMPMWERVQARACWRIKWGRRLLEFIGEETKPTPEVPFQRIAGLDGLAFKGHRLPDASWLDDAAALRLAALHVATRPYRSRVPHVTACLT